MGKVRVPKCKTLQLWLPKLRHARRRMLGAARFEERFPTAMITVETSLKALIPRIVLLINAAKMLSYSCMYLNEILVTT